VVFLLNYIWAGLILLSFIASVFTGRTGQTAAAVFDGAKGAVQMCITLLGIMSLWTGLMKIGEKSGMTEKFAKLLSPVTRIIFPKLKTGSAAMNAIVMNMVANMFGLSNAATPLGLAAMRELEKINPRPGIASDEMCMFTVINTASIQIIPSTVIALRLANNSANPTGILLPVWIASLCSLTVGVVSANIMQRRQH